MYILEVVAKQSGGKDPAAIALGRKGGANSRKYLSEEEKAALGRKAVKARWEAYYKAHPEKLKAKLGREVAKGKRN